MKSTALYNSFKYALAGLWKAFRQERNLRIHLAIAIAVIALAGWLSIGRYDWAVLILTIGAVFSAELFNTSLETVVDLVSPEHHELAKTGKDVAAAAVFILAITSIPIGLLILGPPMWHRLLTP